ncbi:ankyrin repeat-containing domain protein [Hypomontagnella monticulosa]|nr:ankyrin repeat-containing domain protein [Hypomontagnella monticulosa]
MGANVYFTNCWMHKGYSGKSCMSLIYWDHLEAFLDAALDASSHWLEYFASWFYDLMDTLHSVSDSTQRIIQHIRSNPRAYRRILERLPRKRSYESLLDNEVVSTVLNLRFSLPHSPGSARLDEYTALHYAAANGLLDYVWFLIDNGADVNATVGFEGFTPLMMCAKGNHPSSLDIAHLLLDHDADINATSVGYKTALRRAVGVGNLSMIKLLIQRGADISSQVNGDLLEGAAVGGDPKIFHHLIQCGLDPTVAAACGCTPASLAVINSRFRAYLLNNDFRIGIPSLSKLLCSSAEINFQSSIKLLYKWKVLETREALNHKGDCTYPICVAAQFGHTPIVELLAKLGALLEVDNGGGTALMLAASYGKLEVVKVLVRMGARMAYVDAKGERRNIIHEARHRPATLRWLLVGQHVERKRLQSGLYMDSGEEGPRSWSPATMEILLSSRMGRNWGESSIAYAGRRQRFLKSLQGLIVHGTLRFKKPDEELVKPESANISWEEWWTVFASPAALKMIERREV